jgi:SAM-dependent methyltransferase
MSTRTLSQPSCRACGAPLGNTFADLGPSPISNALIKPEDLHKGEMFYPLHARVCEQCWLVQLDDSPKSDAHFHDDYVYFSSFSDSWLAHARHYVETVTQRFGLHSGSRVLEIASNDGYLLQYFVQAGIPCLGIEPTANTAAAAREKGVQTRECFFGRDSGAQLAAEGWHADLVLGNNVLAHVPDINDFVGGLPVVLKPGGVVTFEFPHLLRLIEDNQFDTIYHEHYSYLSLLALEPVFRRAGLRMFDVEKLTTHGGSLRIFVCHRAASHATRPAVEILLAEERQAGLDQSTTYASFASRMEQVKRDLLDFLITAKREGKRIAGYGAPAKGNTLLNYCGVRQDFIDFTVDRNPHKQGRWLPGTRIPVHAPDMLRDARPDYVLILPWNIKDEIISQLAHVRGWGGRFVVPIPRLQVIA